MSDPAPVVWFVSFGDSALNFRLRGYVENADIKLGVTSELNYVIEQALREHGINIPFPQRDVHLYGLEPLADAVTPRSQASSAAK
jgi:small-conductance mechanosensitive channel